MNTNLYYYSVWSMAILCSLSLLRIEKIDSCGSLTPDLSCSLIAILAFKTVMSVPVRPTPALQWMVTLLSLRGFFYR